MDALGAISSIGSGAPTAIDGGAAPITAFADVLAGAAPVASIPNVAGSAPPPVRYAPPDAVIAAAPASADIVERSVPTAIPIRAWDVTMSSPPAAASRSTFPATVAAPSSSESQPVVRTTPGAVDEIVIALPAEPIAVPDEAMRGAVDHRPLGRTVSHPGLPADKDGAAAKPVSRKSPSRSSIDEAAVVASGDPMQRGEGIPAPIAPAPVGRPVASAAVDAPARARASAGIADIPPPSAPLSSANDVDDQPAVRNGGPDAPTGPLVAADLPTPPVPTPIQITAKPDLTDRQGGPIPIGGTPGKPIAMQSRDARQSAAAAVPPGDPTSDMVPSSTAMAWPDTAPLPPAVAGAGAGDSVQAAASFAPAPPPSTAATTNATDGVRTAAAPSAKPASSAAAPSDATADAQAMASPDPAPALSALLAAASGFDAKSPAGHESAAPTVSILANRIAVRPVPTLNEMPPQSPVVIAAITAPTTSRAAETRTAPATRRATSHADERREGISSAEIAPAPATFVADAVAPRPEATATLAAAGSDRQIAVAQHAAWADGIARDIASAGSATGTTRFTVAPATLGMVTVEVSRTGDAADVRLVASSEAARAALDAARPQLIAEAKLQGLHIRDAQIDLGGASSGNGGSQPHRHDAPQQIAAAPLVDQPRGTNTAETNSLTPGSYGGGAGGDAGRQAPQQQAQHPTPQSPAPRPGTTPRSPERAEQDRAAEGRYA